MEKFTKFMEKYFIPVANKMSTNRVLKTISSGSMSVLGVILIGSIFSVLGSVTWEPFQSLLKATNISLLVEYVPDFTTDLLGLYMTFAIAYSGAKVYGIEKNAFNTGLLSLVSFILISPVTVNDTVTPSVSMLNASYFGSKAVISAIIVSLITVLIMKFFMDKDIIIKMPDGVPPMVTNSFISLIPGLVIITFFGAVKIGFGFTNFGTMNDCIYTVLQTPLQALVGSFPAFLAITIIAQILWFFGIHGSTTVLAAIMPIWLGYMAENTAALEAGKAIPNLFNFGLMDLSNLGGCGATIGLVVVMFFFSKSKRYKTFSKIVLPAGIFSINEPVVFGMPLMLNVMTLIPFILCPVVIVSIGYALMHFGIIAPYVGMLGTASLPPFFHGLVNGSIGAGIYEIAAIFISAGIWYPFFKILDKQAYDEEQAALEVGE